MITHLKCQCIFSFLRRLCLSSTTDKTCIELECRYEGHTLLEHLRSLWFLLVGSVLLILLVFCVVFLFCCSLFSVLCSCLVPDFVYVSSVRLHFKKWGSCCTCCPIMCLHVEMSVTISAKNTMFYFWHLISIDDAILSLSILHEQIIHQIYYIYITIFS